MTYEFAKYPDGTLGVFSNIGKRRMEKNTFALHLKDPLNKDLILIQLNFQVIVWFWMTEIILQRKNEHLWKL